LSGIKVSGEPFNPNLLLDPIFSTPNSGKSDYTCKSYLFAFNKHFLTEGGGTMKVFRLDQVAEEPQVRPLFTGPVTMQTVISTDLSKRFLISQVNFAEGVRNKFHSHSIEQVLIITKGKGIVATDKEEITVVPGDIIFIAAGEKHWHGAVKGSTFSHLYVMAPGQETTQYEE
jgi:quercetin dioxygenase-like cupin family protein